ncbi:MAG: hypothetical protein IIY55_00810, partial [Blautia sp.]|nr:hypothetical protein [Blautia sp.]
WCLEKACVLQAMKPGREVRNCNQKNLSDYRSSNNKTWLFKESCGMIKKEHGSRNKTLYSVNHMVNEEG